MMLQYVKTRKLDQPIGITPGYRPDNRNYIVTHTPRMVWSGDHHTPPLDGSTQTGGTESSTRQSLKEGRCGLLSLCLKLSDTGFSSLADKRRLEARSTGAV